MTLWRACVEYDEVADVCTSEAWVQVPTLIPPMSASDGLMVSGWITGVVALAWTLGYVRRYLAPRS